MSPLERWHQPKRRQEAPKDAWGEAVSSTVKTAMGAKFIVKTGAEEAAPATVAIKNL